MDRFERITAMARAGENVRAARRERMIADLADFAIHVDDVVVAQAACPTMSDHAAHHTLRLITCGMAVVIEQCCDDGELLPEELRESRLAIFAPGVGELAERTLRAIPNCDRSDVCRFIYWLVRGSRARRTGSPEL